MADTFTQEILEQLRKYTECSEFERWDSADKKAADYYKRGYLMALDEIEQRLDERRKEWAEGPNFEGFYSSVGDFMGSNALRMVGQVLFGVGWEDDNVLALSIPDVDKIQSICDKLYPHRYLVQCFDLGEKDIQVLEIGI